MIKIRNKKKIALVLSGGGIKACAYHVGVCLALQEKGFRFIGGTREKVEESPFFNDPLAIKTYVGSSAGALVGSFLASGHKVEDIMESFQAGAGLLLGSRERTKIKPLSYFDIFALNSPSLRSLAQTIFTRRKSTSPWGVETLLKNNFKVGGFFTSKKLETYLRKHILPTNSFNELGVDFFAVATHLDHSRKAVFGPKVATAKSRETTYVNYVGISDAVAASISLPPVFAPYAIANQDGEEVFYFDGEIRDTLSTHVAADCGADLILSSYSIQPYHYTKEIGSLSQFGIPVIVNQALYQVVEQKILKSIQGREDIRVLIAMVEDYFKENNLPAEHVEKLVEAIVKKTNFKRNLDHIYIHPQPQDHEMFFVDHFSLNPEILGHIVKIGFKSAINVLRKFDI
jgi:predicted acylesterase/phospholipase RssA